MVLRLRFSWKRVCAELLTFATAIGLSAMLLLRFYPWLNSPGHTSILEVMAILLALVVTAGMWGAVIGGLFGKMKLVGRIVAYAFLCCLIAVTLSGYAAYMLLLYQSSASGGS